MSNFYLSGICMDINPYEFKDSSKYEFANYHKQNKTVCSLFCLLLIFLYFFSFSSLNFLVIRLTGHGNLLCKLVGFGDI